MKIWFKLTTIPNANEEHFRFIKKKRSHGIFTFYCGFSPLKSIILSKWEENGISSR